MDTIRQVDLVARDQVKGVSESKDLSTDPLRVIRKVGEANDWCHRSHSLIAQDCRVVGSESNQPSSVESIRLFTQFDEVLKTGKYPACRGGRV
jgi:hypothetical protein